MQGEKIAKECILERGIEINTKLCHLTNWVAERFDRNPLATGEGSKGEKLPSVLDDILDNQSHCLKLIAELEEMLTRELNKIS